MTETVGSTFGPVLGHEEQKRELAEALNEHRLHHAWIFSGPRGIGKARLATVFAASLLAKTQVSEFDFQGKVSHLIQSGAHPDLRIIQRPVDDKGKRKAEIPVDSIRKAVHFFDLKPAMGGWRIAIVDAVDELNRNSANALLKTLEEPPENALIILIHHGETPLLPTLRSRCRRLSFGAMSDRDTTLALQQTGLDEQAASAISGFGHGSPGRALQMQSQEAQKAHKAAVAAGRTTVPLSAKALSALLSAGSRSDIAFMSAFDGMLKTAAQSARNSDTAEECGAWSGLHLRLSDLYAEARGLNMDKSQAIAAAVMDVQRTRQGL